MAPPPAKRQKRLVVLSSDDEEEETITTAATNGSADRALSTRSRAKSAQTGTDFSPKTPARSSKVTKQKQTSKPISSFFNTANQAQAPPERRPHKTASSDVANETDDQIEDASSNEDVGTFLKPRNTSRAVLDRRKKPGKDRLPKGGQKFKLTGNATSTGTQAPVLLDELDSRPWTEKYGPCNLDELVVHKKKVSDVRGWLDSVFMGRNPKRLLILKGPSGAGKTATISTLAKTMDVDLAEWRNPVGSDYSSEGYLSMSAQFEEFLGRSGKFGRLDLSDSAERIRNSSSPDEQKQYTRRMVILLEEFPNTFLSTSAALRSFQASILGYLAVSAPTLGSMPVKHSVDKIAPLVMVITETRLATTSSASESFTAHRLLGADILSHPGVSVIDFNPVAPTLLTKALDLVIQKEARESGRRRIPGPTILRNLGEVGDVRNAIASLEFLCLRGKDGDDWGGRVASRAKKGAKASSAVTNMEKESLEMVTQRESSLGLFHAVGKVVYNKRDDAAEALSQPLYHMQEHSSKRVSQVSVENLIGETGTDTGTFVAALHENYVLSCEGSLFVDTINNCLDSLSDSDILGSSQASRGGRSFQGAASDSLRLDEIRFQLAVRGLLFALPDPVKRRAHPVAGKGGGKSDTYKMFYPTSMRLARQMEEVEGYLDRWADRFRAEVTPLKQSASNRGRQFPNLTSKHKEPGLTDLKHHSQQTSQEELEPMRTNLYCTKAELILERLPYITKIEQRNPASSRVEALERITQFHGIKTPNDESSEDEGADMAPPMADWATDRRADLKIDGSTALQQGVGPVGKEANSSTLPADEEVEKMYLSDDDIED